MSKHTYANRGLWRLEITLNGLWWYGQIGVHQERCHSSLGFIKRGAIQHWFLWTSCFRNELLAVSISVGDLQKEWSDAQVCHQVQPITVDLRITTHKHYSTPLSSRLSSFLEQEWTLTFKTFSLADPAYEPPGDLAYLVYWEDTSKSNLGGFLAGLYIPQFADTQILAIISAVPILIHSWLYQLVYACASCASRGARGKFEMAKLEALSRRRCAVLRLSRSRISERSKSL